MKFPLTLLVLLGVSAAVFGVNSPRPSSFSVNESNLVITWTNLSTNHGWIVSYKDGMTNAWLWENQRLEAMGGTLTIIRPMTEPIRMFRLWPSP
jgi:hypothetical protein